MTQTDLTSSQMFSTTRPLYGQTAIVTGAAKGIGRAIAIALGRAGAHVVVNYLQSSEAAADVVRSIQNHGSRAVAIRADVRDEAEASRLIQEAAQLGNPHILVNNAGISQTALLQDTTLEAWNTVVSSNLTAPFLCTRAALPSMIHNRYGRIINISSIWGMSGGSCEVAYSASKGGLIAFTKALAQEVGPSGVTVNAVAPGVIETDMLEGLSTADLDDLQARTPVGRLGTPSDVAHAVLFLASPGASFVTGQVISPNGGFLT